MRIIGQHGLPPVELARRIRGAGERATSERARLSADALHDSWRRVMTGARTGRVYRINGRLHQASAVGEPPAELFGEFRNTAVASWEVHKTLRGWEARAGVEPNAAHYRFLAFGTRNMRPRPIIGPVLRDAQPALRRIARMRIL